MSTVHIYPVSHFTSGVIDHNRPDGRTASVQRLDGILIRLADNVLGNGQEDPVASIGFASQGRMADFLMNLKMFFQGL